MTDYTKALRYLESFPDYEKIGYGERHFFDPERMRILSKIFENPEKSFPAIHIAGTKGKGSTASFISGILKEAGFTVGLYTSPHLTDIRERIKINGDMISESELVREVSFLRKQESKLKMDSRSPLSRGQVCGNDIKTRPTFFEIYTMLAFNYFKAKRIDYGVIETGLGGRLDATNIVHPLVSVISPVSYDHMDILGNDLESIAFEKCGIIKAGSAVVSAPQKSEVLEIIKKACSIKNAQLTLVGRDIKFNETGHDTEREVFDILGELGEYSRCVSYLLGRHQIINAASAIGAIEALMKRGVEISNRHIKQGIEKTQNPTRCEIIAKNPYIVLDSAQNRASAAALTETIKRNFKYRKLFLILASSKKKDIKGMCEEFMPLADCAILTKAKLERAEDPRVIASIAKDVVALNGKLSRSARTTSLIVTSSVREAIEKARGMAGREDLILVTGSFFIMGEAKAMFGTAAAYR